MRGDRPNEIACSRGGHRRSVILEKYRALIDWLAGSLEGVYIPKALSLLELGKCAVSVLGVSWAQIRGKIVKVLSRGELIVDGDRWLGRAGRGRFVKCATLGAV